MKKNFMIILFFLMVSTNVYCEPSKTIKTLVDTPVSMLDFGVYRMGKYFERNKNNISLDIKEYFLKKHSFNIKKIEILSDVVYEWNTNTIDIIYWITLDNVRLVDKNDGEKFGYISDDKNLKTISKIILKDIKKMSFIIPNKFRHSGYTDKQLEESIKEILNFIKIKINFIYYGLKHPEKKEESHLEKKEFKLESMMISDKIMYSE